jgi:hypothetical protein
MITVTGPPDKLQAGLDLALQLIKKNGLERGRDHGERAWRQNNNFWIRNPVFDRHLWDWSTHASQASAVPNGCAWTFDPAWQASQQQFGGFCWPCEGNRESSPQVVPDASKKDEGRVQAQYSKKAKEDKEIAREKGKEVGASKCSQRANQKYDVAKVSLATTTPSQVKLHDAKTDNSQQAEDTHATPSL